MFQEMLAQQLGMGREGFGDRQTGRAGGQSRRLGMEEAVVREDKMGSVVGGTLGDGPGDEIRADRSGNRSGGRMPLDDEVLEVGETPVLIGPGRHWQGAVAVPGGGAEIEIPVRESGVGIGDRRSFAPARGRAGCRFLGWRQDHGHLQGGAGRR